MRARRYLQTLKLSEFVLELPGSYLPTYAAQVKRVKPTQSCRITLTSLGGLSASPVIIYSLFGLELKLRCSRTMQPLS